MGEIYKQAKLFEAGHYEDKGLDVSEEDLDEIVSATGEVPLTIGHLDPGIENPLQLGSVGQLHRKGPELFGVVRFLPEAWALVAKSGARWLSVCLDSVRKKLIEVSLVVHPRVADARVRFANDAMVDYTAAFDLSLDDKSSDVRRAIYEAFGSDAWVAEVYDSYAIVEQGASLMKVRYAVDANGAVTIGKATAVERRYVPLSDSSAKFDSRLVEALGREREAVRMLREERVACALDRWKRSGQIASVSEEAARALLAVGGATAEAFVRFMDAQPAGLLTREIAPFVEELEALPELDADEVSFCELAGIATDEYRKMKAKPGWRARG